MYKKTITFTDYDGNERTEDFFFNLNQTEAIRIEASTPGGFSALMQRVIQKQDAQQIIDVFEMLIAAAYGEKSPDGREFRKSAEITERFKQTEAYNKLFVELCTDSKAASAFFNNIIPKQDGDKVGAAELVSAAQ